MSGQVEVGAVVSAVYFAPAEGEKEFYVAGRLCVMGKLFMIVITQVFFGNAQIHIEFLAELFKEIVQLAVLSLLTEGLEFHLFKFDGTEGEVSGSYFVSESLTYLSYGERQLGSHGALYVKEVYVFPLGIFGAEVDNALAVGGNAPVCLEHQVEFAYSGII